MKTPSAAQIHAAVARLAGQASDEIRRVMENAKRHSADELVTACQRELAIRGSLDVSTEQAVMALAFGTLVEGLDLKETVKLAFHRVPPASDEVRLIRLIASNPNSFSAALQKQFGGGFNLYVGHLVYSRYGFFRKFMGIERDDSSILILKDVSSGYVFYNGFKFDVLAAFKELRVI